MPYGFTCKEVARALSVGETKASTIMQPLMHKVAKLFRYDPEKAMRGIVQAMDEVTQQQFEQEELPRRERMAVGRQNRETPQPARR